jgi:hypothetical protein
LKTSIIILQLPFPLLLTSSLSRCPCKKNNRTTNPWYDKECKIARKSIRDASNESLKLDKINTYKSLIKRKKMYYINKRQEWLLHLSKLDPKKFWRKILIHNTKENNMIPLRDWNSYLKSIYKFPNAMDTIPIVPTEDEVFSLDDIEFRVKRLANGKAKDIEGYQDEIFKIGGPILIPHIHKLFNLAVKQGFPKPWTQSLIVPIFKNGDRNIPSNYRTIMISPILAKLYGIILEKKISLWLESHGKRAKGQARFRRYHSTVDHLVTLRIIAEEFHNTKTNLLCCFVDFRKSFDTVPRKNLWDRLEEIKVPFELRVVAIRLYENVISKFKNTEGLGRKKLTAILESSKVVPCPLPFLAYTLTS